MCLFRDLSWDLLPLNENEDDMVTEGASMVIFLVCCRIRTTLIEAGKDTSSG